MWEQLKQHLHTFSFIKTEQELQQMWDHFQKDAPRSFGQTHFELAGATGVNALKWEEFLKLPFIQEYIQEQMALINETNKTKAMINLGNAKTSTDIQAAKLVQQMAKNEQQRSSKPFTINYLPKDTLLYKRALLKIYKQVLDGDSYDNIVATIFEVIPPSKDDLDAITKIKALTAS